MKNARKVRTIPAYSSKVMRTIKPLSRAPHTLTIKTPERQRMHALGLSRLACNVYEICGEPMGMCRS